MSIQLNKDLQSFQRYIGEHLSVGTFNGDRVVHLGDDEKPMCGMPGNTASPLARAVALSDAAVNARQKNDHVRRVFLKAVSDQFGGLSRIPDSVLKELKLKDYGLDDKGGGYYGFASGKPLTERRILAVLNAIRQLGAVEFGSSLPDPVKNAYDGDLAELNFNDEVKSGEVGERIDEQRTVGQFDEMLQELCRHSAELGGAPNFNGNLPRLPSVDMVENDRINTARVYQKMMKQGGIQKLAWQIVGAATGVNKMTNTAFESAALYLDGLRRLANNANFVLHEFETRTLDEAISTLYRFSGLKSHAKDGFTTFSKAALLADIRFCLKCHYHAFQVAKTKGNVNEFFNLCAGGACFQDSVGRLKDYLIRNDALAADDAEFNLLLANLKTSVNRTADLMRANNGIAILDTLQVHTGKTDFATYVWDEIRAIYSTRVSQHVPNAEITPLKLAEVKDFIKSRLREAAQGSTGLELSWYDEDIGSGTKIIKNGKVKTFKNMDAAFNPINPPKQLSEQDFDAYVDEYLERELADIQKLNSDGTLKIELLG